MAHTVLAGENALHNVNDGMVFAGARRCVNCILVAAHDVREQIACVFFTEDLSLGQGEDQRLAYAESSCAVGIWKGCRR